MTLLFVSKALDGEEWRAELERLVPGIDFRVWPEVGRPEDVAMIAAWKAPRGEFARYPNLGLIVSLGHGVDHLFGDPDLPADVPIARLVDDSMKRQMPAWVLAGVLRHHGRFAAYERLQREARWAPTVPRDPTETHVGILGLGALGTEVARHLVALGFAVSGWSRTPKEVDGVESFAGDDALERFLGRCDVIVSLLPHTPATEDILNAKTFGWMKRGAYLVNAGRGALVVEDDLLAALDTGRLSGAFLDVTRTEPLPADSPLWRRPEVVITPHVAAETFARSCAPQLAENYRRLIDGRPLLNLVERDRGY